MSLASSAPEKIALTAGQCPAYRSSGSRSPAAGSAPPSSTSAFSRGWRRRDVLRKVEVISTVSGGSILGALYYLRAQGPARERARRRDHRRALRPGRPARRADAVRAASRDRCARSPTPTSRKNLRMRRADYSRSDRIGELYDEIFYRPAWGESQFGGAPAPRPDSRPIQMRELLDPAAGRAGRLQAAARQRARRNAPVPVLLLNATSLNTGPQLALPGRPRWARTPRGRESWVQIDKNMRLLTAPLRADRRSTAELPARSRRRGVGVRARRSSTRSR